MPPSVPVSTCSRETSTSAEEQKHHEVQPIHIDRSLPREERTREFRRQTKGHPDCVIIDGVIVLSRFKDTTETIEDRLREAIRNA